jgi:hypothetical protein
VSSWTPSILIALAAGEARSVTPLMAADGRGGEIVTHVPVAPGDEVGLQVRCSAGARRLLLDVRARVESRQPAEKGHRVRFHWLQPDEPGLAVMATIARELGIMVDRPSPAPQADEAISVRAGEVRETFLVDLQGAEQRAALADQLLSGSLMVETDVPLETNTPVLVRLALPDARALWLTARVVYRGEAARGRPGLGLALETPHEVVRRELRRLKDSPPGA